MRLQRIVPPAVEPVSLAEAKAHLRVEASDDDALITGLVKAARTLVEETTGRALVVQTWRVLLDGWPAIGNGNMFGELTLPQPPTIRVDAVRYIDGAGAQQTLASATYEVIGAGGEDPATFKLAWGATWPTIRYQPNAIELDLVAGFDDGSSPYSAASVPETMRLAIKLLVGEWYENREAIGVNLTFLELPLGVRALLAPHRVWLL